MPFQHFRAADADEFTNGNFAFFLQDEFPDFFDGFVFFQQGFNSRAANALDIIQLIFESTLASFLSVKGDSKAMHFIPDPADQFQAFAVIG